MWYGKWVRFSGCYTVPAGSETVCQEADVTCRRTEYSSGSANRMRWGWESWKQKQAEGR